ncbi:MAG: 4Fe-4S binding protein [Armatimonadota bacterium]|nr:4Fe-4S binding protein [Armatimonadota bacterium]MDR7398021.1 4Fe-4S binding protein [Armatimonadota bacterium]MDR7406346.1 4Fe-4S binding protein [Armatimonadota bacterium]MDR7603347.1 4Fe-4S binding protein [Armatimonadota bacterium]
MTAQPAAVLICADVARASRVNLTAVEAWLQRTDPHAVVRVAAGLCEGRGDLESVLARDGAGRAVLGLCGDGYDERELQSQLRQAGIDPLSASAVRLGRWCAGLPPEAATEKAKVMLAAAVAAARASGGSTVANAKPYFPARGSRRSFLRFPVPAYRVVPSVDGSRCAASAGCSLCVEACPFGALSVADGRIELDKDGCEGCGRCVSACPREAFHFPGYNPKEVEARVRVLLDPEVSAIQPRGILFVCACASPLPFLEAGWMPVELPCAAMLPAHWLLAPLLLGAVAVGVVPCERQGSTGCGPAVLQKVDFCQALLRRAGRPAELVRSHPPAEQPPGMELPEPLPRANGEVRFQLRPEAVAAVLLRFVGHGGTSAWEHPGCPLGLVEINPATCTGCGMCATACPSEALQYGEADGEAWVRFDPARCTACGLCVSRCPEQARGAIHVSRRLDPESLRAGSGQLLRTPLRRCVACGAPVAPALMLNRVLELLGEDGIQLQRVLTQYCPSCRPLWGAREEARRG